MKIYLLPLAWHSDLHDRTRTSQSGFRIRYCVVCLGQDTSVMHLSNVLHEAAIFKELGFQTTLKSVESDITKHTVVRLPLAWHNIGVKLYLFINVSCQHSP